MQSIVIVGAGTVGRPLGCNLLRLGHRVRYAVRDMASAEVPDGAEMCPVGAAATSADLVLLAVPFDVVEQVVARLASPSGPGWCAGPRVPHATRIADRMAWSASETTDDLIHSIAS